MGKTMKKEILVFASEIKVNPPKNLNKRANENLAKSVKKEPFILVTRLDIGQPYKDVQCSEDNQEEMPKAMVKPNCLGMKDSSIFNQASALRKKELDTCFGFESEEEY